MIQLDERSKAEADALQQFILSVSLPLVFQGIDRPEPFGTGTLFKINGRSFLITAAHVLRDAGDISALRFPNRLNKAKLVEFGDVEVFFPAPSTTVDVAVVEIKSATTISILEEGSAFLSLENVEPPGEVRGRFHVAGYVVEHHVYEGGTVKQNMFHLTTDALEYTPLVSVPEPEFDQFFYNSAEGEPVNGASRMMPSLRGASGASIWIVREIAEGLWSPQRAATVVGVQVSESPAKKWFRGAAWSAVRTILRSPAVALTDRRLET